MSGIAQRFDFTVYNNADWTFSFPPIYTGLPSAVPWANTAQWEPNGNYRSDPGAASFVQNSNNLYVANPANSPSLFISGTSFSTDLTNSLWIKVGDANTYSSTPTYTLSGVVLRMRVAPIDINGNVITPVVGVLSVSSDGSGGSVQALTGGSGGVVSIQVPKTNVTAIAPGVYGYDMNSVVAGPPIVTTQLFFGQIIVIQGATW